MRCLCALQLWFALTLLASGAARAQETFVIPLAEDTLLYIENRGATRILAELNGTPFKLATDPAEVAASANAFLVPLDGVLTIDIAAYMRPGADANVISFVTQGPPAAAFRFVLAPVFVEAETRVAYTLRGLTPLPETFALRAGPSPGRGPVTVSFAVPAARTAGVDVRVSVYDALGRRVAVLADGARFPGAFRTVWPADVAQGLYLIRLESDTQVETARVVRVR